MCTKTIHVGCLFVLLMLSLLLLLFVICYTPSFFLLYKSNTIKIPISCITVLLTGQQFIDLLPAIELLTDDLIFIGLISHVILTSQ